MKINQVAELVGITKKNIRFYEEQGLVEPERNPENGYREYTLKDVEQLEKVKLFRQLGVSCENIRKLQLGQLDLEICMTGRLRELEEESASIEHMRSICHLLAEERKTFSSLDASSILDQMKELEKGGGKFMNVQHSDVKKRMSGAVIAAISVVGMIGVFLAMILWANSEDPAPIGVLIFLIVVLVSVVVGVLVALRQRIKEVKKGEIDEASKY
ncbi:MAG: MerR family transcriptional regulator [Firmicutes bacterium]|nr:MerR family transcriptional regulator [Bacillota bacterium]